MTAPRAVIIDTDPGQDDAIAILLALACPDLLDIRAITVVAGNVPLPFTQRNARAVVELSGRTDVPIYTGCDAPSQRRLITAERIHGTDGLEGAGLPEPTLPLAPGHAVDAIIRIVMETPEASITLCPLGPLTNVAAALMREPAIARRLDKIVLMGGAIGIGNVTPSAEFNIYVDPHAAAVVFGSGVPIVMVPLEATHQAIATFDWVDRIAGPGNNTGRMIAGMLRWGMKRNLSRYGGRGVPLHDPCVTAYLLWPALFSGHACAVEIETVSELTLGRTVVDRWGVTGRKPNALVIDRLDADELFLRMAERLATLP